MLQIAASKTFGADQWSSSTPTLVQLGHPDACTALSNPPLRYTSLLDTAFPTFLEMKNVPGAHVVLSCPT